MADIVHRADFRLIAVLGVNDEAAGVEQSPVAILVGIFSEGNPLPVHAARYIHCVDGDQHSVAIGGVDHCAGFDDAIGERLAVILFKHVPVHAPGF